jgi:hypothetical protein
MVDQAGVISHDVAVGVESIQALMAKVATGPLEAQPEVSMKLTKARQKSQDSGLNQLMLEPTVKSRLLADV